MNLAEQIILIILAVTLWIFLILGIVVLIRVIQVMNRAKHMADTGVKIADKSADIADHIRDGFSSVAGAVAGAFASSYANNKSHNSKKGEKK